MELTHRVLDYDKHLSEGEYLDELAGSVAVDDLFAATVELLQSSDYQTLSTTLLFVQDLILWSPGEERQAVQAAYPESIVVQALESLLDSKCHGTRRQAAYVLGKTGSESSVPAMTAAFHRWRDRDPSQIMFMRWVRGTTRSRSSKPSLKTMLPSKMASLRLTNQHIPSSARCWVSLF
jgi:hypothetical protein